MRNVYGVWSAEEQLPSTSTRKIEKRKQEKTAMQNKWYRTQGRNSILLKSKKRRPLMNTIIQNHDTRLQDMFILQLWAGDIIKHSACSVDIMIRVGSGIEV